MPLYLHKINSSIYPESGVKYLISDKSNQDILNLHQKMYQMLVDVKLNGFLDSKPTIDVKSYALNDSEEIQRYFKYLNRINQTPNFYYQDPSSQEDIDKIVERINQISEISNSIREICFPLSPSQITISRDSSWSEISENNSEFDDEEKSDEEKSKKTWTQSIKSFLIGKEESEQLETELEEWEEEELEQEEESESSIEPTEKNVVFCQESNDMDFLRPVQEEKLSEKKLEEDRGFKVGEGLNVSKVLDEYKPSSEEVIQMLSDGSNFTESKKDMELEGYNWYRRGRKLDYAYLDLSSYDHSYVNSEKKDTFNLNSQARFEVWHSRPTNPKVSTQEASDKEILEGVNDDCLELVFIEKSVWDKKMVIMTQGFRYLYFSNKELFPEIQVGLISPLKWSIDTQTLLEIKLNQLCVNHTELNGTLIAKLVKKIKAFVKNDENVTNNEYPGQFEDRFIGIKKSPQGHLEDLKEIVDTYLSATCYRSPDKTSSVSVWGLYNNIYQHIMKTASSSGLQIMLTTKIIADRIQHIYNLPTTNYAFGGEHIETGYLVYNPANVNNINNNHGESGVQFISNIGTHKIPSQQVRSEPQVIVSPWVSSVGQDVSKPPFQIGGY